MNDPHQLSRLQPAPPAWVAPTGLPPERPGGPADRDAAPSEMTLLDVLRILGRRWLLVLALALVGGAAGAYLGLSAPTLYRANAVIRLQDTQKALTGMADPTQPNFSARLDALLSLLEVMRSEMVLSDVVDRSPIRLRDLRTGVPPAYFEDVEIARDQPPDTLALVFSSHRFAVMHREAWTTVDYGETVTLAGLSFSIPERPPLDSARLALLPRDGVLRSVRSGLSTRQRASTDVVDVNFTAGEPILAQVVINEVVEAFQRSSVRMSQQQLRMRRTFLEEQLRQAREAQEEAQLALSRFRSREQVYSSQSRLAAEQQSLQGIDTRREELATERRFYRSILDELERPHAGTNREIGTLVAYPGITSNPVVASLLQQLIRYESEREELTTGESGVRRDHPDVRRIDALIASTQGRLLDAVRGHLEVLDSQVAALNRQQDRGSQQMRQLPDTEAEEVRLVQRADAAGRLTLTLEGELQQARIAEAVEAGQVEILERARSPGVVGGSRTQLMVLMGLMLGLLFGSGAAFALEHLNTSIKHQEELEQLLRVPGLAVIPRIPTAASAWRQRLALKVRHSGAGSGNGRGSERGVPETTPRPTTPGAEAYRALRTSLIFSRSVEDLKTAVVTSATPQEGKTTTAANLAIVYAQHGMSVLLIDADLRRARQHKVFNVAQSPGLSEILLGTSTPAEAIRRTSIKGLSLLPAGKLSPNPADVLGGRRMRQLLESLRDGFDIVLVDAPPVLAVADATILSLQADGALLVVRAGRTDRDAVQAAVQKLDAVGARVIGAVLNDPEGKVSRYSPYYSYGYLYSGS